MRVCIHRGTAQIGGTCIELEAENNAGRVILDLGRPLDVDDDHAEGSVPPVRGLQTGAPDLHGVLISHPHQDHVGLVEFVHPSIPIAIGAAGQRILDRAATWLQRPVLEGRRLVHWSSGRAMQFGPFTVTPFLVDHSAYDAYAMLIEADGQRVFYSGDFRGHGRKSGLFEKMLAKPSADVDTLLMEGTVIGRAGSHAEFPTETSLETDFIAQLQEAKGLTLVWTSSQNIDRLVTLYRATKRCGKRLVLDAFTAEILAATENPRIPQGDWPKHIGVYVPQWMRRKMKRDGNFSLLESIGKNRVFLEDLDAKGNDILLFRPGLLKEVAEKAPIRNARLLYSNWSGYLADDSTLAVRQWLDKEKIPIHHVHTSGHASVHDLTRFANAIGARQLVPIHSFETGRFSEFFANVARKQDGKWWQAAATH